MIIQPPIVLNTAAVLMISQYPVFFDDINKLLIILESLSFLSKNIQSPLFRPSHTLEILVELRVPTLVRLFVS